MLKTETPSSRHPDLDQYELPALIGAFVEDQVEAVNAVRAAAPQLAEAVARALPRIEAGGRILYAGAGTSGRLGVLDSVELYPTFSWPRERALAILAGGQSAMFVAVEGAEDDAVQGQADLNALQPGPNDVLLALAASGGTPYVLGAIRAARAAGALVIGFANNADAPVTREAEVGITLDTGPEVISGSTRLKAGSAQKMALNTFSSALMVKMNKVYGNLMVDLKATNAKLVRRALALTMRASGADEATAQAALQACDHHVKTALVMIKKGVDAAAARALLDAARGSVRQALAA
ncbi:N-acetylmuramic acid 6-phosphate etherase [Roseateles violae]|uniref:N-acetylmuramic acid 6-phosphate etherase n=1 Tax=Roseateles violae TaxID=3058042 RepID=A0ABT8DM18_9BURK|nr:N-acetylmuramic acid 6-phosphate etherase [Pelomonas sp. PFR6]MDN3919460.1 N-acetylmuramic acid 6-phosphate etherase [Pelomonas sp. PFR6]